MKKFLLALIIMSMAMTSAYAQRTVTAGGAFFNPVTRTGTLRNVDAGAIINSYTNPPVQNTYEFVNPDTVGKSKESASDVINVEKMDAYGKIIINP